MATAIATNAAHSLPTATMYAQILAIVHGVGRLPRDHHRKLSIILGSHGQSHAHGCGNGTGHEQQQAATMKIRRMEHILCRRDQRKIGLWFTNCMNRASAAGQQRPALTGTIQPSKARLILIPCNMSRIVAALQTFRNSAKNDCSQCSSGCSHPCQNGCATAIRL